MSKLLISYHDFRFHVAKHLCFLDQKKGFAKFDAADSTLHSLEKMWTPIQKIIFPTFQKHGSLPYWNLGHRNDSVPVLTTDGYTHLHLQSACLQGPAFGPILGDGDLQHRQKPPEITGFCCDMWFFPP